MSGEESQTGSLCPIVRAFDEDRSRVFMVRADEIPQETEGFRSFLQDQAKNGPFSRVRFRLCISYYRNNTDGCALGSACPAIHVDSAARPSLVHVRGKAYPTLPPGLQLVVTKRSGSVAHVAMSEQLYYTKGAATLYLNAGGCQKSLSVVSSHHVPQQQQAVQSGAEGDEIVPAKHFPEPVHHHQRPVQEISPQSCCFHFSHAGVCQFGPLCGFIHLSQGGSLQPVQTQSGEARSATALPPPPPQYNHGFSLKQQDNVPVMMAPQQGSMPTAMPFAVPQYIPVQPVQQTYQGLPVMYIVGDHGVPVQQQAQQPVLAAPTFSPFSGTAQPLGTSASMLPVSPGSTFGYSSTSSSPGVIQMSLLQPQPSNQNFQR